MLGLFIYNYKFT